MGLKLRTLSIGKERNYTRERYNEENYAKGKITHREGNWDLVLTPTYGLVLFHFCNPNQPFSHTLIDENYCCECRMRKPPALHKMQVFYNETVHNQNNKKGKP